MTSERVQELKVILDGLIDKADLWPESPTPQEQAILNEAVANFKNGGAELLDQSTEYLWSYYRDVADNFSPEELEEYDIAVIHDRQKIWEHVQFRNEPVLSIGGDKYQPGCSYISFEGEVSWEPEHGLQLVFEHGQRVCKVGPFNGACTNAYALADLKFLNVIYR